MSATTNTEWPPAEEIQTRRWLLTYHAVVAQEAEEGRLAAHGATSRLAATNLIVDAATRAAEHYSFLRGLLDPITLLPPEPDKWAIVTNLLAAEVRELAARHDELAGQAEQQGDVALAEIRRARAAQLRALVGDCEL